MATQPLVLTGITAAGIAISGWLTEDQLPKWAKSLIAALVVFLAAIIYAAITGQITGNFTVTFAAISAIIGWLMVGPLEPVHAWLTANWTGPLALVVDALVPIPIEEPLAPRAATIAPPRPSTTPRIALPTTADIVSRSSLLTNDPTWRATVATPRPLDATGPALQVPSVDLGHVGDVNAASVPTVSTQPPASNGDQGPATNPMQAVQPPPPQPTNGTQPPDSSQGGQSAPPSPYGP